MMQSAPASLLEQVPQISGWFRPLEGRMDDGAAIWHPFHQQACTLRLLPCAPGDQQVRARKIIRRLHRLRHDNIVPIHDILLRDQHVGLIEGVRDGYTLRDSLREFGALDLKEALAVFRQILIGVSALHQASLAHGDLRPDNILLDVSDRELTVRLRGVGPGMLGAEPLDALYLSPERIGGGAADFRSDIFALGVMFYECIAGKRPFDETEPWALRKLIRSDPPTPLQTLAPDLPMKVAFAVNSALKADPSQRFADATSFARAFPEDVVLTSDTDTYELNIAGEDVGEPEVTEVIDVPESQADDPSDEPSMTATALSDAVGDIDWDEVRRHAEPLEEAPIDKEEPLAEQLGGRSVDMFLETTRIARLLAIPAILATALMMMLSWQNITSARETQQETAQIEDELSRLMAEVGGLGQAAIRAGVEPNAIRPLVESYQSARSESARRRAAETMAAAVLRMLRSLPEAEDTRTLQERRNLELKASRLHLEIQNYHASTDRYQQQNKEPMGWIVDFFRL